ncbi:hypothetical protein KC19_6G061100 [Ceratodon purpureus]|uniref:Uncharacterized protein n=1 Tax=Ceratodon purpureus TaxID=3225 RepID=A0A8T0HF04_CERPU|nr:hypothetical protein KC19_6G061100 [Ceratodon purpureus]
MSSMWTRMCQRGQAGLTKFAFKGLFNFYRYAPCNMLSECCLTPSTVNFEHHNLNFFRVL